VLFWKILLDPIERARNGQGVIMALVKLSTASQISGKVGGNVYATNRYGQYMRSWAKPTNPQSEAQTAIRANLAAANAAWAALTPDVQAGWETIAAAVPWVNRLGDTTYLTARQCLFEPSSHGQT
jgi:hypothetical protein